ncbi:MAG TPA: hypothetical protein RMH85_01460 [Polyangiaceae bacterium LLY-WYZ-15_(1-7)]|nr:hypothetical protein [Polyangiaceae bacterium LLY-WYZ-15_(1-7)]HJL01961.1 hypothetical protein [Polyangiaceae bacterium LLY-WYZ-15_(1-7)]HJL07130.1 hypothetical protein [Polyangiaceae bacterium LLY-WYZ-15_(1-7)]
MRSALLLAFLATLAGPALAAGQAGETGGAEASGAEAEGATPAEDVAAERGGAGAAVVVEPPVDYARHALRRRFERRRRGLATGLALSATGTLGALALTGWLTVDGSRDDPASGTLDTGDRLLAIGPLVGLGALTLTLSAWLTGAHAEARVWALSPHVARRRRVGAVLLGLLGFGASAAFAALAVWHGREGGLNASGDLRARDRRARRAYAAGSGMVGFFSLGGVIALGRGARAASRPSLAIGPGTLRVDF